MIRLTTLRYRHCPNKLAVLLADQIQMMLIAFHFFSDIVQNETRAAASSLFELMAKFVNYLERKSIDEDNIDYVKQIFSDKLLQQIIQSLPNINEIAFYTQFQKSLKYLNLKI